MVVICVSDSSKSRTSKFSRSRSDFVVLNKTNRFSTCKSVLTNRKSTSYFANSNRANPNRQIETSQIQIQIQIVFFFHKSTNPQINKSKSTNRILHKLQITNPQVDLQVSFLELWASCPLCGTRVITVVVTPVAPPGPNRCPIFLDESRKNIQKKFLGVQES